MHRGERAERTSDSTSRAACGQLQQATGSGDASWEEPRTGRTGATRTWTRPGKGGGPALEYHIQEGQRESNAWTWGREQLLQPKDSRKLEDQSKNPPRQEETKIPEREQQARRNSLGWTVPYWKSNVRYEPATLPKR